MKDKYYRDSGGRFASRRRDEARKTLKFDIEWIHMKSFKVIYDGDSHQLARAFRQFRLEYGIYEVF